MIDRTHDLPIVRQCEILRLSRSTACVTLKPTSPSACIPMRSGFDFRSRSKFGLYDFNKNRSRTPDFPASYKTFTVDAQKAGENGNSGNEPEFFRDAYGWNKATIEVWKLAKAGMMMHRSKAVHTA